ncbi:MAG: hypothetical protein ABFC24_08145 [Methanoregulaceae archaeon]
MQIPGLRTWVIFYLLCFVGLLWAAFLTVEGTMLWVSLTLILVVIGVNVLTIMMEVKRHAAREELQKSLSLSMQKSSNPLRDKFKR